MVSTMSEAGNFGILLGRGRVISGELFSVFGGMGLDYLIGKYFDE